MRIIGGQYKGFRFDPPANISARPTTDRAKESLVNILLSNYGIDSKRSLDLFSGTGNMAYELASQGSGHVTAIDISFHSVDYIRRTFSSLKYSNFIAIKSDVFKWLNQNHEVTYDIIFADPPYDDIRMAHIPELIYTNNLLSDNGVLVVEHRSTLTFQHEKLKYHRDYGQSRFSFFE